MPSFFQTLEQDLRLRCSQLSGLAQECSQLADRMEVAAYARHMSGQLDHLHTVMTAAQSGLAGRLDRLQVREHTT
jgi:hypothetical protein